MMAACWLFSALLVILPGAGLARKDQPNSQRREATRSPNKSGAGWINVAAYATHGDGSSGNPWTGWDTAITWTSANYHFPYGHYRYAVAPNWAHPNSTYSGEGIQTMLHYTGGSGNAVNFTGYATNITLEDMAFLTGTADVGLYLKDIVYSTIRNIYLSGTLSKAVLATGCMVDVFDRLRLTPSVGRAVDGVVLGVPSETVNTTITIINPDFSGVSGTGLKLVKAIFNTVVGGTIESNGKGVEILAESRQNNIIGTDFEFNSTVDIYVESLRNSISGVNSTGATHLASSASYNTIVGGTFHQVTVEAGAKGNTFLNAAYGGSGGGGFFTDKGTETQKINLIDAAFMAHGADKLVFYGPVVLAPEAVRAGTMTVTSSAVAKTVVHRFDWTNAMVTALGAAMAGDITVCTLPARTVVRNAWVVINTAAGGVTRLSVAVGRVSAAYSDYIVASDAKAAANTVYGGASGERGSNLTGYDMPSYAATTAVKAHFISTGTNLNTVITSTGSVFLETEILP